MKILLATFGLFLVLYLALCASMYARQRDFIYFPQYTRVAASQTDFAFESDGHVLRGWVVNPGRRSAVLYFGGNAESLMPMREELARLLPAHTSYLVAYRGFGASDGTPGEDALARDAIALFDRVRARHPQGSVAIIGRSLGTGVASHVAARRPVARLVLITPFDSLANVARTHYPWMPVRWLMRERFDSAQLLANYRGEVLVVRAGRDRVVPPASTDRLIAALTRAPQILDVADGDHIDIVDRPGSRGAIRRFLE